MSPYHVACQHLPPCFIFPISSRFIADSSRYPPSASLAYGGIMRAGATERGMCMTRQPEPSIPSNPGEPSAPADFATQYRAHSKPVFQDIVRDELAKGADAGEQSGIYAELGKPDFVLAYLLAGTLPEADKRDLYARAFVRRAELTEARAGEFDKNFHRPFPMLLAAAARDRATARRIRAGHEIQSDRDQQIPIV